MASFGAPHLPAELPPGAPRWKLGVTVAIRVVGLLFVTTLTTMLLDIARVQWVAPTGIRVSSLVGTPIPLTPPVLHLIAAWPVFFRPKRGVESQVPVDRRSGT